jgi:hypothetical protein
MTSNILPALYHRNGVISSLSQVAYDARTYHPLSPKTEVTDGSLSHSGATCLDSELISRVRSAKH